MILPALITTFICSLIVAVLIMRPGRSYSTTASASNLAEINRLRDEDGIPR